MYKSLPQLINSINWVRAGGRYVIRDPNNKDLLLYLDEKLYNKLVLTSLANDQLLDVIVTPDDDLASVRERFSISEDSKSSTPNLDPYFFCRAKLFSMLPGWKVKESMIHFERNFDSFIPSYYRDVTSWLRIPTSKLGSLASWELSRTLDKYRTFRGTPNMIMAMKIATISVLHYVSGNPVTNTEKLGQRIRIIHGLPKMIPPYFRSLIRTMNPSHLRVILTLLSSYKGISAKYKDPDFSSITAEPFEFSEETAIKVDKAAVRFFKEFNRKKVPLPRDRKSVV